VNWTKILCLHRITYLVYENEHSHRAQNVYLPLETCMKNKFLIFFTENCCRLESRPTVLPHVKSQKTRSLPRMQGSLTNRMNDDDQGRGPHSPIYGSTAADGTPAIVIPLLFDHRLK
jgi:hypothetical protein